MPIVSTTATSCARLDRGLVARRERQLRAGAVDAEERDRDPLPGRERDRFADPVEHVVAARPRAPRASRPRSGSRRRPPAGRAPRAARRPPAPRARTPTPRRRARRPRSAGSPRRPPPRRAGSRPRSGRRRRRRAPGRSRACPPARRRRRRSARRRGASCRRGRPCRALRLERALVRSPVQTFRGRSAARTIPSGNGRASPPRRR